MNPNTQPDPAGDKPGVFQRLRRLPGSRTAAAAFVLTIALGVGGPAAYAWWSQQGRAEINVTAGAPIPEAPSPEPTPTPPVPSPDPSPTPSGPPAAGPNPVLAGWPGKPSGATCTPLKDISGLKQDREMDIRFGWNAPAGGTAPTGYVVRVASTSPGFAYDVVQNVTAANAVFRFPRSPSNPGNGGPTDASTPYYTSYTVRVMPMNGEVAGDPLYWTYQYEHWNISNCHNQRGQGPGLGTVGNTTLSCLLPERQWVDGYTGLTLNWQPAQGATSYRVTVISTGRPAPYGRELSTPDAQAAFRFAKQAAAYGDYTVRVQPMNGAGAGDPAYLTYQLGPNHYQCFKTTHESL